MTELNTHTLSVELCLALISREDGLLGTAVLVDGEGPRTPAVGITPTPTLLPAIL